jgi:hypothetical protein
VHRNVRAHLNRLRFLVAAFDFFAKFLEDALNQFNFIVHNFNKRRVSCTIPQHQIFTKTRCQLKCVSIAHISNIDIVLVINVDNMTGLEVDLLIALIVTSA